MSVCVSFPICCLEYSSVTQVKVHIALDIVTMKMPALCYLNSLFVSTPANSDQICDRTLPRVSQSNSQSVDPNSNPEPTAKILLPNDPPGVPHLAPEILSHYCDPVSDPQDD